MLAIEVGTYKTIEQTIIPIRELLFECIGRASEPIDKALPNLFNLRIRHLYGVSVPHLNRLGLSCYGIPYHLALVDVGNGVVQGMLQQVDTIVSTELPPNGILVRYIGILAVADNGIFIHIGVIGNSYLCLEELRSKHAVDL